MLTCPEAQGRATAYTRCMNAGRRHRRAIAAWVILLLLFMQAATAAYACPQRDMSASLAATMEGCEGGAGDPAAMDRQHPLLCIADCEQSAQASKATSGLDVPAATLRFYALAILPGPIVDSPGLGTSGDPAARGEPPPGWPPLYLLNRILRN
jgi:hypothetical protein